MSGEAMSRGREHFDRLYECHEDPWNFRDSAYESGKYAATLGALKRPRFESGLEVGCSVGELTWRLAQRCARLLAIDIAAAPLALAAARCADQPHVRLAQMQVPAAWPAESFDLVVLSEVLYFLSPADIARVAGRVGESLRAGGVVLLVNWLGQTDDPCTGDEAAERFMVASPWLRGDRRVRTKAYRIDVLVNEEKSSFLKKRSKKLLLV